MNELRLYKIGILFLLHSKLSNPLIILDNVTNTFVFECLISDIPVSNYLISSQRFTLTHDRFNGDTEYSLEYIGKIYTALVGFCR